ncbi:hypothetical protein [Zunongwangia atlantica]|uniref:hypothetical protein n=1 Tax=Zunongwangia atlantica TaxID=1502297 RepID=UPI001592C00E|nr:hypothetical protein [Zunongwangia atlantica]
MQSIDNQLKYVLLRSQRLETGKSAATETRGQVYFGRNNSRCVDYAIHAKKDIEPVMNG